MEAKLKKEEELEKMRKALLNMLEDFEEEKERTKSIINSLTDGLIVLDSAGKVTFFNPEVERLLGLGKGEIKGKNWQEFFFKSPFKEIEDLMEKKKNLFREEISLSIPKEKILEVTTLSIIPQRERIIILHDISREKAIERMRNEFVSLASHQLRTPLSEIKWALKMFLDGDLGSLTKEQREFLEKTYRSNEKMIILIRDLLDVAIIEEGKYLRKLIPADFRAILKSVLESYKEKIEEKKLKIELKAEKELPKIKVDEEKIKIVIDNLLGNAIKYSPAGSQIVISLSSNEKEMRFSVKDSGIGIPKSEQEKIFKKFFRASNAKEMATEGTGLGLFITKNIVEAHGGKIWFESEEGKGTTFYFALPVKK